MATIKGHVEIMNPVTGKVPAAGMFIVFQRVGCRDCLVGVYTDSYGDYRLRIGQGRYKAIVRNPSPPEKDMLDRNQKRYVRAASPIVDQVFDLLLLVP
ncbi:MAG: hypothetical protein JO053_11710 [Acidobacteria bacterium]|nr:hypothetical protein [Acidobacteriota bacterium]